MLPEIKMEDNWTSGWVSLFIVDSSKNLRWAEDKLNSGKSEDIFSAIKIATKIKKILEEHDNIKELDCWKDHREILKDWIKDILSKAN